MPSLITLYGSPSLSRAVQSIALSTGSTVHSSHPLLMATIWPSMRGDSKLGRASTFCCEACVSLFPSLLFFYSAPASPPLAESPSKFFSDKGLAFKHVIFHVCALRHGRRKASKLTQTRGRHPVSAALTVDHTAIRGRVVREQQKTDDNNTGNASTAERRIIQARLRSADPWRPWLGRTNPEMGGKFRSLLALIGSGDPRETGWRQRSQIWTHMPLFISIPVSRSVRMESTCANPGKDSRPKGSLLQGR